MPFAARVGDMHICPMTNPGSPPPPHVGGPINPPGEVTVLIEGKPAATATSMCTCSGPPDQITQGSQTVLIGNKPAARLGDPTAHGGQIILGAMTVIIGG
ncbi:MAG TPA: PAAR domain-containing protein [Saprospiraceae bacterium]|nr:PAAR domain-containing protein [Saprospiraceae bacterium]